jgi:N-acetylglucosamine malate deacetylase 1
VKCQRGAEHERLNRLGRIQALEKARGDRVAAVFLTSGELGLKRLPREKAWSVREAEAKRAAKILGIAKLEFLRLPDWTVADHIKEGARLVASMLQRMQPEIIYVPHPLESHPDHKAALLILRTALRKVRPGERKLLGYEVWTPLSEPDSVEDISKLMSRKLRALRAHASQLKEFDYVRAVRGLNEYRGVMMGRCRFAEVFQTLSEKPGQ